jgi:transcriptional regulator with XRE-family HTH domain
MKLIAPLKTEKYVDGERAGKMIRKARKAAGIKQYQLAAEMKIPVPNLCMMEKGWRPWTENLFTLAALSIEKLKH